MHWESFLVQGSFSLQYSEQGGAKVRLLLAHLSPSQDTEDLDHYEMKEEEPADGKKTEDEGIGKENLAILEKIKKNQRQDYLNVRVARRAGGLGKQRDPRARAMEAPAGPKTKGPSLAKGTAAALRSWPGWCREVCELPLQLGEVSGDLRCPRGIGATWGSLPAVRSGVPLRSQELHLALGCGGGWWVVLLYSWAEILPQFRGRRGRELHCLGWHIGGKGSCCRGKRGRLRGEGHSKVWFRGRTGVLIWVLAL